ncbi:hypothetical protein PAXINDRAFT_156815 [Paxillus involutus ATCC 200175]|uniref:Uncharacterized protein n=1 Tax=Paxillus involutus ATCC 200175 TaxID=664439 RepID=A0A0C9SUG4_PAXIN|nr:hypothetical protein PAXINDRAFT_156815 [Paxillus involutus ATCC 200175]
MSLHQKYTTNACGTSFGGCAQKKTSTLFQFIACPFNGTQCTLRFSGLSKYDQPSQWVESMDQDQHLSGKKWQAAVHKKKKLQLSPCDWSFLEHLCEVLVLFHTSTLSLQKKGIPMICQTLPLYKMLEKHIEDQAAKVSK